jgi:nicotinamidase-related amidase
MYTVALRLYPADYHARFASEMLTAFEDAADDRCRGPTAVECGRPVSRQNNGQQASRRSRRSVERSMPTEPAVAPARSAVLSMDYQSGIVSAYVKDKALIPRVAQLLHRMRRLGLPIVHVKVGFRPNVPEASPRNTFLSAVKASLPHQRFFQNESGAIHPGIGPEESDLVVTKSRVSAFAGTDLGLLLRANDIDTLILFGIATSGVVLSTLLEAADMDYRLFVVKDCCADLDPDLHTCLIDKLFPRQATVVTADGLLDAVSP